MHDPHCDDLDFDLSAYKHDDQHDHIAHDQHYDQDQGELASDQQEDQHTYV